MAYRFEQPDQVQVLQEQASRLNDDILVLRTQIAFVDQHRQMLGPNDDIPPGIDNDTRQLMARRLDFKQQKLATIQDQLQDARQARDASKNTIPFPDDRPVDPNANAYDLEEIAKMCKPIDPEKPDFKTIFRKLFAYGENRLFTHGTYELALGYILPGNLHEEFVTMREAGQSLQECCDFFITKYCKPDDPTSAMLELNRFKRKPDENIKAAMARYQALLLKAQVLFPPERRDAVKEERLTGALFDLVKPDTREHLKSKQRKPHRGNYFITYEQLLKLADDHEFINTDTVSSSHVHCYQAELDKDSVDSKADNNADSFKAAADMVVNALEDVLKRNEERRARSRESSMERRQNNRSDMHMRNRGINHWAKNPIVRSPTPHPSSRKDTPSTNMPLVSDKQGQFGLNRKVNIQPASQHDRDAMRNEGRYDQRSRSLSRGRNGSSDRRSRRDDYWRNRSQSPGVSNFGSRQSSRERPRQDSYSTGGMYDDINATVHGQYKLIEPRHQGDGMQHRSRSAQRQDQRFRGSSRSYDRRTANRSYSRDRGCSKCGGRPGKDDKSDARVYDKSHSSRECHLYKDFNYLGCSICRALGIKAHHFERYCMRNPKN